MNQVIDEQEIGAGSRHPLKFVAATCQRLLRPLALGDVGAGHQDRSRVSYGVAVQHPAGRDNDPLAVATTMHHIAEPAIIPVKFVYNLVQRFRKLCLQQFVRDFAKRFLAAPTVQFFGAMVPVYDPVLRVADKDGVVTQVQQTRLFS